MQGVQRQYSGRGLRLELTTPPMAATTKVAPLTIEVEESSERRIGQLISENPVIIFSRTSCCMCHVMKKLLSTLGVHPTVIELEEGELGAVAAHGGGGEGGGGGGRGEPAVFIGGYRVGGLESLMALHLSGLLVPKLREVGAMLV